MSHAPGFVHIVFFWLQENVTDAQRQQFHKGVADLTKCKTIQAAFIGPPAMTPRQVVDNSYDYALVLHFANKDDHDIYQKDPDHHTFIDAYQSLWARVQVYDYLPVN